jgi:hypothetical protein
MEERRPYLVTAAMPDALQDLDLSSELRGRDQAPYQSNRRKMLELSDFLSKVADHQRRVGRLFVSEQPRGACTKGIATAAPIDCC